MLKNKRQKSRKWIVTLLIVILLAAGGGGYFWWNQATTASAKPSDTASKTTTQVKTGTINLSALGTGTVVANQKSSLSFSAEGIVTAIHVQVGDKVTKGKVLAEISDTESLEAALKTAELGLTTAKKNLNALLTGKSAALANAQLAVAEAQEAYDDAKAGVVQAGFVRCNKETLDVYYVAYLKQLENLEKLGDGGGNTDYYINQIVPQRNKVAQAKALYDYCAGYTTYEIESSQATAAIKKAALEDAQETFKDLVANAGIDPTQRIELQNKVDAAQISYTKAKEALAGTTLVAPYDGTILSVAGEVGDTTEGGTFITMADLDHPILEFAIDESDMDMVAVGYPVEVTFDALTKQAFTGKVTRIYPTLSTSGNYQVLKGLVQLSPFSSGASRSFPVGMNASVTIVAAKAENVLLVPLEALRDLGGGEYGVMTADSSGSFKLVSVKVGLKDATYAEIKEGLTASSVVSTGKTEMK